MVLDPDGDAKVKDIPGAGPRHALPRRTPRARALQHRASVINPTLDTVTPHSPLSSQIFWQFENR